MSKTLEIARLARKNRRLHACIALLLNRGNADDLADRVVMLDLVLAELAGQDIEAWARFGDMLAGRFAALARDPALGHEPLLAAWERGIREDGLGAVRDCLRERLERAAGGAGDDTHRLPRFVLDVLRRDRDRVDQPLDDPGLTNGDLSLVMRRLAQSQRLHGARLVAELRLQPARKPSMWDHWWYASVLADEGEFDAAFDAQSQFVRLVLQAQDMARARSGVLLLLKMLPQCTDPAARLQRVEALATPALDVVTELDRTRRLVADIAEFRELRRASQRPRVIGRDFVAASDLAAVARQWQAVVHLDPSPPAFYELAKARALLGDDAAARECLLTAARLDASLFGMSTGG